MWIRRRELVFPQEEAKQQALQQLWGDIAAIVTVRKGGEMDVAVYQVFFDHLAPYIIVISRLYHTILPYPLRFTSCARCSIAMRFRLRKSIFPVPNIGNASTFMKFWRDGI